MFSLFTRTSPGQHLPVAAGRGFATKVAALAAIPALLLGTGSPAVAASNTLTVTALDRSGAKVSITTTVVNLSNHESYTVRTGKSKKLPKGTYAVLASIATGDTTTLGGTTVKVSGASKATLDARKGKLLTLALNPAPVGLYSSVTARICTKTGVRYEVEAYANEYYPVYVIPNTSKKLAFAALGSWTIDNYRSGRYT